MSKATSGELDLTKLTPENLDFLHRLRSALDDLAAALFDWIKPLQDVLIAADELDRNPSELPSFVLGRRRSARCSSPAVL